MSRRDGVDYNISLVGQTVKEEQKSGRIEFVLEVGVGQVCLDGVST